MSLDGLAKILGGVVIGGKIRAPAPGRPPSSRSLVISRAPRLYGGIHVYDWATGDHLGSKAFVLQKMGLPPEPSHSGSGAWQSPPRDPITERAAARKAEADAAKRTQRALEIWHEAQDPYRSPVETYLVEERALSLPAEAAGTTLRYHPRCPFRTHQVPTMVALLRDIVTDRPVAIHRTALSSDGRKVKIDGVDRLTLGPSKGAAIKLTPQDAVGDSLGVGEGIESVLSLPRLAGVEVHPIWSLLSAGGVRDFPVLPELRSLWLAVDNDAAGLTASATCAARYRRAGTPAHLVTPSRTGADLNDVLKEYNRDA